AGRVADSADDRAGRAGHAGARGGVAVGVHRAGGGHQPVAAAVRRDGEPGPVGDVAGLGAVPGGAGLVVDVPALGVGLVPAGDRRGGGDGDVGELAVEVVHVAGVAALLVMRFGGPASADIAGAEIEVGFAGQIDGTGEGVLEFAVDIEVLSVAGRSEH